MVSGPACAPLAARRASFAAFPRRQAAVCNSVFYTPRVRSKPTHEKQYDQDEQDDADHTDAAVTEPVSVAAKAPTEATKQDDDEEDDEYESERPDLSPDAAPNPNI